MSAVLTPYHQVFAGAACIKARYHSYAVSTARRGLKKGPETREMFVELFAQLPTAGL